MVGRLDFPPEVAFEVQGSHHELSEPPSITENICDFIHEANKFDLPDHIIRKLKDLLLDTIGVGSAASNGSESSKSFLLAVTKLASNSGPCSVWGQIAKLPPHYAAMLNASFIHSFDFDDTFAKGSLHPSCTVISAGLAQAEISTCSGKSLLKALAFGYELVCRLGAALGTGGYARGFHNTSTAGIFGAVATIAVIKQLPLSVIRDSIGIAGSQAGGSMQFLENGSWNIRLHPGLAVHNAFMAVNFAEAGVVGSAKAIEGKYGFLSAYSAQPNYKAVLEGLGSQWLFEETAPKPFPACRMTHSAIEVAAKLGSQEAGRTVKKIVVHLWPACWNIAGIAKENKIHPKTIVDAQFSIYFQVATAWLYEMELGWRCFDDLQD